MDLQYAVVLFIEEDNAPGVIVTDWLNCSENRTFYPKVSSNLSRDKLLRKMASPDENWREFPVKVLKKYKTLLEAQQALAKAEETSNLSSEDEEEQKRNRGMRKKKRLFFEDENNSVDVVPPLKVQVREKPSVPLPYPSPSSLNIIHTQNELNFSTPKVVHSRSNPSPTSHNQLTPNPLSNHNFNSSVLSNSLVSYHSPNSFISCNTPIQTPNSFTSLTSSPTQATHHTTLPGDRTILHQLQMQMTDLIEKQNRMEKKVDMILSQMAIAQDEKVPDCVLKPGVFGDLPIKNMEKFEELEETLKDEQVMKQLVRMFTSLGGKDLKSSVNTIMRRIMVDDLAMNFSYSGKSTMEAQKVQFSKYSVCKCLQVAVRKTYSEATETVIKNFISSWLQQAKYRTSRRKKDAAPVPEAPKM